MRKKKKGRPKCVRVVKGMPEIDYFKPRGIPLNELESVTLKIEEVEAIRLVDFMGLKQEDAGERMGVSRRTLARELKDGRRKIAEALLEGKAIEIKGGFFVTEERLFMCRHCRHEWIEVAGTGKPTKCPECGGTDIQRRGKNEEEG